MATKYETVADIIAERDQLRAYAEALNARCIADAQDAERYRWLLANSVSENDDGEKCVYYWCGFEHYSDVSASIDAAMAADAPGAA